MIFYEFVYTLACDGQGNSRWGRKLSVIVCGNTGDVLNNF
jgi:hypothetical protein